MRPIQVPRDFRIVAHRGASAYAPENTLPAFRLAAEMGVREIETDARLSVDGVVVLCHDKTLERYGYGDRTVETTPFEELAALDMGSWFSPWFFAATPLLTLDGLFGEFGDAFVYHLELKGETRALPKAVYSLVLAHGLSENVIYASFSSAQLTRMRALSPSARLALLADAMEGETLRKAKALHVFQICPRADRLTPEGVKQGCEIADEIRVWGMRGSPQGVRDLINSAVRCGCHGATLDWPDWVCH